MHLQYLQICYIIQAVKCALKQATKNTKPSVYSGGFSYG